MIRRPPRSTLSSSSAASDVYKRQVSTQSTGGSLQRSMSSRKRKSTDDVGNVDLKRLKEFLTNEEDSIRDATISTILNDQLPERITAAKQLSEKAYSFDSYAAMRDHGFIDEVRSNLQTCFRMASRLEAWLNTYQPPLSSGGTAAVSSDVQDGIFGSMHSLSSECSEALMRMFALEKDRALMRTKTTEEKVWERYEGYLDNNQMHDIRKTCLTMNANVMSVANVIANNIMHLTNWKDDGGQLMY
eukprot:TRINITY_DN11132_c0_g1_i4.p1 TRINITY_DN11132_c0_g1~~TRINITY_DN11132_c0_g1_i4.p1  ORF type:complete len:244 (-),score=90.55 TRINITY_DN11132_c0_g1_i4:269-1000(-)